MQPGCEFRLLAKSMQTPQDVDKHILRHFVSLLAIQYQLKQQISDSRQMPGEQQFDRRSVALPMHSINSLSVRSKELTFMETSERRPELDASHKILGTISTEFG